MAIPATLLDAVTSTGAGSAVAGNSLAPPGMSHHGILNNFSVVVVYATEAPTAATVDLEGSHDNSSWVNIGTTTDVSGTVVGFAATNYPFPYIRGNLSAYTAGSCTGVTVTCIGTI